MKGKHTAHKTEENDDYGLNQSFRKDFVWLLTQSTGKQFTFHLRWSDLSLRNIWVNNIS